MSWDEIFVHAAPPGLAPRSGMAGQSWGRDWDLAFGKDWISYCSQAVHTWVCSWKGVITELVLMTCVFHTHLYSPQTDSSASPDATTRLVHESMEFPGLLVQPHAQPPFNGAEIWGTRV